MNKIKFQSKENLICSNIWFRTCHNPGPACPIICCPNCLQWWPHNNSNGNRVNNRHIDFKSKEYVGNNRVLEYSMGSKHFMKKSLWLCVTFTCVLSLVIQLWLLAADQISPSHTETTLEDTKLEKIKFPVIFKICFKNAFNLENLRGAGYEDVVGYFQGVSRFNKSLYGWAGHSKDGSAGIGVSGISQELRLGLIAKFWCFQFLILR